MKNFIETAAEYNDILLDNEVLNIIADTQAENDTNIAMFEEQIVDNTDEVIEEVA